MKSSSIIILLAIILTIPSYSQGEFTLTNFEDKTIPASPTAAALGEYGFSPIDLSTGQANLTVPIYTIKGTDISLPISFSYRAGVKIKETSPYTGHGWSMLAGGVITRSIHGAVDPTQRVGNVPDEWTADDSFEVNQQNLDAAPDVFNYNFMGYSGQFALEDDFQTPYYIKEQRNWLFEIGISSNQFEGEITIVTEDGTKYIFAATETTSIDDETNYFGDDTIVAWHLTEIISAKNNEKIELSYYSEEFGKPILKNKTLVLNPLTQTSYVLPEPDKHISFKSKKLNEIILYKNDIAVSKIKFEANTLRNDLNGGSNNIYALSKISIFDNPESSQPLKYFDIDIENVNERLFLRSIQEFSGDGNSLKPSYKFEYIKEHLLPGRLEYKADHWGYYSSINGTEFPYSDKVSWKWNLSKDPSSSAEYGSLRKVTFPTGGYNIFNYESNEYYKTSTINSEEWFEISKELKLNWRGDEWFNDEENAASNQESYDFTLEEDRLVKLNMNLSLKKGLNRDNTILKDEIEDYRISIIDLGTQQEVFKAYFEYEQWENDEISLFIWADSFVNYDYLGDASNHSGSVLNSLYVSSANLAPYNFYDNFFEDNDIIIGESLDRSIDLDLKAGHTYRAIITTSSTIDNDMVNSVSEVSLKLVYLTNENQLGNNDDLVDGNLIRKGGGIRIKSQVIGTEDTENIMQYDYVIHDTNGLATSKKSGQITEEPTTILYTPTAGLHEAKHFQSGQDIVSFYTLGPSALWARVGSTTGPTSTWDSFIGIIAPLYSIKSEPYQLNNSQIFYSEVKVTNGEAYANSGFTLHKYHKLLNTRSRNLFYNSFVNPDGSLSSNFVQYGGLNYTTKKGWPFNAFLELNPNHSKLESKLEYKFNGAIQFPKLIKQENYAYDNFEKDRFLTSSVQTISNIAFVGTTVLERQYSLLKSKETILYDSDGNNPITTRIDYEYNSPVENLLTKISTTDSKGDKLIKKLKYFPSYIGNTSAGSGSSITLNTLYDKNIFAPIEEQIWKGNDTDGYKLIDGTLSIYDEVSPSGAINKLYQPIKILKLETESSAINASIATDFVNSSGFYVVNWLDNVANYNYRTNVNLDYYNNGSLKEVSQADGTAIIYIWGYNEQYPIAKIENLEASQITTTIQNLIDIAVAASNNDVSENDLRTSLSNLRNTPSLNNSMVTTYTYDPLIGITSVTDPKGYTQFYLYDNLNRLKQVKDAEGKILSENEYHYKGQ
jgi:hypothetical protein